MIFDHKNYLLMGFGNKDLIELDIGLYKIIKLIALSRQEIGTQLVCNL